MPNELSVPNGGPKAITVSLPTSAQPPAPAHPVDRFRGVSEHPLSKESAAILCAGVKDDEVSAFPASAGKRAGLLYVSHSHYRNRLTKAIGPCGWALVQDSAPIFDSQDSMVYWTGTLYVLGHYVSSSVGQQQHIRGLKGGMSYADAVEGSKSDCLVRCCKDLGMFWELWDPNWRQGWAKRMAGKSVQAQDPIIEDMPLVVPDGPPGQPAPTSSNLLDQVNIGDQVTLEGHSCPICTLNIWQVAQGGQKSKNPGRWYIRCATKDCKDEKGYASFGGWWEEITAKYSKVASVKEK